MRIKNESFTSTENKNYFKENLKVKEDTDDRPSTIDYGIKIEYFEQEEYEPITLLMKRIAKWINENRVRPVMLVPIDSGLGYVLFYY